MQVLLDYPIAFSALGLAGIAKKFKFLKGNMLAEIIVGMIIACLLRYLSHVISGYFVFNIYAGSKNPLLYSLTANSVVLVDLAIDVAIAALLFSTKQMSLASRFQVKTRRANALIYKYKTVAEQCISLKTRRKTEFKHNHLWLSKPAKDRLERQNLRT